LIRILIADDHALFRGGLRLLLESCGDMKIAGEVGTGRETLAACRKGKVDIVLLDINMPDIDGIEVLNRLREIDSSIRVMILTMHESPEYATRAIRAGARGYVVKGINPEELPDAIRKVAGGDTYISPSIADRIAFRMLPSTAEDPVSALSDRELYVVKKLASGCTAKEIAEDICLSPRTVETYKNRAMKKLGLKNSAALIRFAVEKNLSD